MSFVWRAVSMPHYIFHAKQNVFTNLIVSNQEMSLINHATKILPHLRFLCLSLQQNVNTDSVLSSFISK